MFGTGEGFDYVECVACGTLQIKELPDLSRHYPEDYYSFSEVARPNGAGSLARNLSPAFYGFTKWAKAVFPSAAARLGQHDLETQFFDKGLGLSAVLTARPPRGSRILDVGCGAGRLLRILSELGYESLTGIDVFLNEDSGSVNGIRLFKKELKEVEGEYDLIMFHHSFEHLAEPAESLWAAHEKLADDGVCLVRIPVVNYAWEKYGVNWVGLDAPRHLHLFTEKGFCGLAERAAFRVESIIYDSTSFQFIGSEQYKRNIPLSENVPASSLFARKQIREWKRKARLLNLEGRGDQAAFYLRPG